MLEMIFRMFLNMGRPVLTFKLRFYTTKVGIYHFPCVIYKEFEFQNSPRLHWIFHYFHKEIDIIESHAWSDSNKIGLQVA